MKQRRSDESHEGIESDENNKKNIFIAILNAKDEKEALTIAAESGLTLIELVTSAPKLLEEESARKIGNICAAYQKRYGAVIEEKEKNTPMDRATRQDLLDRFSFGPIQKEIII